jgi:hypothetical protein
MSVKTVASLLPLAVGLVALGAVIWWLLSRDMSPGRWLLAGLLVGHGLVHLMFVAPAPASAPDAPEWPFDMTRSWLVTGPGLDVDFVRAVGVALMAAVAVVFVLAGLSTAGILVPQGAWRMLVVGGSILSIVLLTIFFNPQLLLGVAIDAILLGVVLSAVWDPTTSV